MNHKAKSDIWRGVLIEEGLEDKSIFQYVRIVNTKVERLEGEEELGEFHFYNIEVDDQNLPMVVQEATRSLRPSWYFHLVRGDQMKVMFRGKVFDITKGDTAQLEAVKKYGMENGIHEEQIQLERLFDNPYDE